MAKNVRTRVDARPAAPDVESRAVPVVDVNEVTASSATPRGPEIDISEVSRDVTPVSNGGYSEVYDTAGVTPSYGSEEQRPSMVGSYANSDARRDNERRPERIDDRTRDDALRMAAAFGVAPRGDGTISVGRSEARVPTRDEGAAAFQAMQEDTPLPNESTRHDQFGANQIAMARAVEDETLQEMGTSRSEVNEQRAEEEERKRQEEYEKAASQAKTLRHEAQRRSIESSNRIKPSIFQRAANFVQRRKEQLSTDMTPTHRPSDMVKRVKESAAKKFNSHGTGYRIYGKMVALPTLDLREIGVGIQEISDVIEQDSAMLDNLLRASLSQEALLDFTSTSIMSVGDVAKLINENYVEVFTCKPPDNRGQDMQRRRLRVLESERRGIYLHPSMAAMYTADYDGDDMQISLDPSVRNQAKDPMEQIIGVDGEQSLDTSFLPVAFIRDGWDEGKNARDYVREIILHDFSKRRMNSFESNAFSRVIDAVVELSRTTYLGSDEQAVAWGNFFRAANAFANANAEAYARIKDRKVSPRRSNKVMSDVITAVCNGFRNVTAQTTLLTIGEVIPRSSLPEAFTIADSAIYDVIDGMVIGAVPNNFQELKVMMNGFMGNVSGKSAPFRFTADVGKMMKLDTRFMISEREYEYDPNDEDAMTDLLQKTVKYAYSARMAVEIKSNGKQMNLMETVRRNVIKEVGFIDDIVVRKDANGNDIDVMRYANITQFLEAFIDSYNRNAAMANEANLVFLTNMGIKIDKNRKAINTIRNTRNRGENRFADVRFTDLATPFIDIYGNYSFNRMFGKYQHNDKYDTLTIPGGVEYRKFWSKTNKTVRGNEDWGVTGGSRWVRGVYGPMSIRAFSVNNRIVRTRDAEKNIHRNTLYNTENAMDSLIAAIADKRTSTSSDYNKKVVGAYRGNGYNRGHVSLTTSTGEKTIVATTSEILKDIRNSNLEGTLLMPGFYAGIGSREAPQEVLDMATEIAKELSKKQFCLRSGHADGMDVAFESGASGNANIYMPYATFNTNEKKGGMPVNGRAIVFDSQSESDRNAAEASVLRYHPTGERLRRNYEEGEANKPKHGASSDEWKEYGRKTGAYKNMRRNYFQIFGTESETNNEGVRGVESAFVVCFDDHGGGTAQAIRMAQDRNIPVFNAADYENLEDWKNDVLEAADKCLQGQLYRTTSLDQMLHVDDAVMAINATGYELFHDLNMDSTAGFLMSSYGRALVRYADNADVIAGIRAAMVFRQQTQQIARYSDQIGEIDFDEVGSLSRWMYLYDQAKFAIDELSDKSLVWKGIVKELYSTDSDNQSHVKAFDVLRSERRKNTESQQKGMKHWNADDFWTNGDYDERYASLRDVIEDLSMPWPLKCDVITDVVRWQLNDPRIQPFEVMYQMEVGSDSRYGNSSTSAVMQIWKDTSSASNRYANYSLRNLRREVKEATDLYRDEPDALTNTIHNLASNPHLLVHVEDSTYADAVLAVRDKLYPQTEKAKKHPWTNFIYSALSYQRNGGFFNDVYRYDDRMLGLQHKSQLSPADILRVLDDPTYYLCVYDDYGSVNILDQHGLLEIDHDASEREIWDWLNENPRIAATILRQGIACVSTDTTGEGRVNARTSIAETIENMRNQKYDTLGDVKYLMRDHPVFAGIVSLLTPAHGTSTRNERNRIPDVENRLCMEIYSAAKNGYDAQTVMQNLGITGPKLQSLLVNDYDKYMANLGFGFDENSIGEVNDEVFDIFDTIMRHLQNYIDEVSNNVRFDGDIDISNPIDLDMDVESIASFWDTIQEFSGAKVGVSTGIEGSETYRLSYWVSHMGAKDGYADLASIEELLRKSDFDDEIWRQFDGAWTNKGKFAIRWTENGIRTNFKQLQALCSNEAEEIVIKVPEGFQVPDRSTDSYGKQVPSLYVSMVSKRSNGAEKFNLKAMKAGLDGTDSVTKMRNKYLTEVVKDAQGNDREYPIFFFFIKENLQNIANTDGIDAARMELAKMMQRQDSEMGYKDLTLANYMSIAEIMLIEGENGEIILRSLEQIVAGVKGRIGCRVDGMSSQQVMDRVKEIIYDTSDQAIGVSSSSTQYEMLSDLRPRNTAGKSPSTNPMRVQSSVFSRNYDLLKQIQEENKGLTMLTSTETKEIHDSIVGPNSGIEDIKEIWDRSDILRNYSVIGYYGSRTRGRESNLSNANIGPSTAVVIGPNNVDSKKMLSICNACYKRGTTVIVSFESVRSIPDAYLKDAIPISEYGDMMIPMFDMRLNGSESRPFQPQFGIFRAEFGRYVISAEDPYNVFNLGDAQYKFTRSLVNRLSAHDSGSVALTAMNLFPNVFKNPEYRNCTFEVGMADRNVIEDLVLSQGPGGPSSTVGKDGEIVPRCTIDYGLVEGANGWDQRVHDVNKAIYRYAQMLGNAADDDGVMRGVELKPGDIVGWAQINIYEQGKTTRSVLAPLIPFSLSGANKVPESFTVVQAGKENNDGSLMSIDWSYNKKLIDGFIKYFDSSGGANKGMISLTDIIEESIRLKNGMDIGAYCAAASTDSRKIGTDRRIKTMISLMAIARMTGYNFARTDGAFPDDPDIKESLSNERLPIDFWAQYYAGDDVKPLKFCDDSQLSAFLNHECKKIFDNGGNPSDYLGTTFTGELDDINSNEHVMWEFECMFENSLSYEDMLLRYLSYMMKDFCPSGIEDSSEDKTFRLYQENGDLGTGFDKGMLQMQVPYPTADGRLSYVWSNVYVGMSFFGEDWSGNSRPNVRGASDTLDAENTNSYYGMELSGEKFRQRGTWSTADYGRPPADCGEYSSVLPYMYDWLG